MNTVLTIAGVAILYLALVLYAAWTGYRIGVSDERRRQRWQQGVDLGAAFGAKQAVGPGAMSASRTVGIAGAAVKPAPTDNNWKGPSA